MAHSQALWQEKKQSFTPPQPLKIQERKMAVKGRFTGFILSHGVIFFCFNDDLKGAF